MQLSFPPWSCIVSAVGSIAWIDRHASNYDRRHSQSSLCNQPNLLDPHLRRSCNQVYSMGGNLELQTGQEEQSRVHQVS